MKSANFCQARLKYILFIVLKSEWKSDTTKYVVKEWLKPDRLKIEA